MHSDSAEVAVNVLALTPCRGAANLLALADVEIVIGGVVLVLHGVQLRSNGRGTEITLPRYRNPAGNWSAAVSLPDELRGPIGDVVIAAGIEDGILRQREGAQSEKAAD